MNDVYFCYENYEILENKNGDCFIKDLSQNKYFFKASYFASKQIQAREIEIVRWSLKDTFCVTIIGVAVASLVFILFNLNKIFTGVNITPTHYILAMTFLLVNVLFHELAHKFTLNIFGRSVGKIKFKFNFIFPALVVDTTDSYILPRFRRGFVYSAGIVVNLIICGITLLLFPVDSFIIIPVIWLVAFNIIPFGGLKTDGYHIIVTVLFNIKGFKKKKSMVAAIAKGIFLLVSMAILVISVIGTLNLFNIL